MKRKLFLFLLTAFSCLCFGQTKKVLFIGNSYTASNNLPKLIHDVAVSVGDSLIYDSHTPGGARLLTHSGNAATISKIFSNNWDHVVIQAQSQEPSWSDNQVATEVFPHAQILCDTIRDNDSCTKPVFYMTWGRENGDAGNCPFAPWVCTYEGMDSVLNKNYRQMGADNNAYVSPVGAVWRYIRENHPGIQLYTADGSHPSLAGSYTAACTFYSILFQKDPTAITFNSTLSSSIADTIKLAAKKIAYDSLLIWNVDTVRPNSSFVYTIASATPNVCNVQFDSQFTADFYEWDFDDGSPVSNDPDPLHPYTANGSYNVRLVTSKNCVNDTSWETIIIYNCGVSTAEELNALIDVYPNPASTFFSMDEYSLATVAKIEVYNMQGQHIVDLENNYSDRFDISIIPGGYYQLRLKFSDGRMAAKELVIKD